MCVNKIEAMYGRSRVNEKVEPRATLTFLTAFHKQPLFLFTRVKFTCVRTWKLCASGNPPLVWTVENASKCKRVTENIKLQARVFVACALSSPQVTKRNSILFERFSANANRFMRFRRLRKRILLKTNQCGQGLRSFLEKEYNTSYQN